MFKLRIVSVGKIKEEWLERALEEYIKRLTPVMQVECKWVKDDVQLLQFCEKEIPVIGLDPQGKMMNSEIFSQFLLKELQERGSRLTFVIGGPEGIPQQLKKQIPLVSLSLMTFTHQITRLILIEQVYRAFEIHKGTSYHK